VTTPTQLTPEQLDTINGQLTKDAELLEGAISATGEQLLEFFRFTHLPAKLQVVSAIYAVAAAKTVGLVSRNPERTVALRKLLEGKDAAVRASL